MTGLDTGFFVELMRGHITAVKAWKSLVDGESLAVVSCITLLEIERLGLRGVMRHTGSILEAIPAVCIVRWIQEPDLLVNAAGLSHGLGLSTVDSIVLASFLEQQVNRIYTTNEHLENYRRKDLEIINLKRLPRRISKST